MRNGSSSVTEPQPWYATLREGSAASLGGAQRRAQRLGWARLVAALLALAMVLGASGLGISAWWAIAPLLAFAALVVRSGRASRDVATEEERLRFAEEGLARCADRAPEDALSGEEQLAEDAAHVENLHWVGPGGLVARMGRCRTAAGLSDLVAQAVAPPTLAEVASRTEATEELAKRPDLLAAWAAASAQLPQVTARDRVVPWLGQAAAVLPAWWRRVLVVLPLINLTLLVLWLAQVAWALPALLLGWIVQFLVWRLHGNTVQRVLREAEGPAADLGPCQAVGRCRGRCGPAQRALARLDPRGTGSVPGCASGPRVAQRGGWRAFETRSSFPSRG